MSDPTEELRGEAFLATVTPAQRKVIDALKQFYQLARLILKENNRSELQLHLHTLCVIFPSHLERIRLHLTPEEERLCLVSSRGYSEAIRLYHRAYDTPTLYEGDMVLLTSVARSKGYEEKMATLTRSLDLDPSHMWDKGSHGLRGSVQKTLRHMGHFLH